MNINTPFGASTIIADAELTFIQTADISAGNYVPFNMSNIGFNHENFNFVNNVQTYLQKYERTKLDFKYDPIVIPNNELVDTNIKLRIFIPKNQIISYIPGF